MDFDTQRNHISIVMFDKNLSFDMRLGKFLQNQFFVCRKGFYLANMLDLEFHSKLHEIDKLYIKIEHMSKKLCPFKIQHKYTMLVW